MGWAMPHFVSQRDEFSCGPVALFNALRWSGHQATCREVLPRLMTYMKCEPPHGTRTCQVERTLRRYSKYFSAHRLPNPSVQEIVKHLDAGGAALICFGFDDENNQRRGHYCLLVKTNEAGSMFEVVNYPPREGCPSRETVSRLKRKTLINNLRRRACPCSIEESRCEKGCRGWPTVWLLESTTRNSAPIARIFVFMRLD